MLHNYKRMGMKSVAAAVALAMLPLTAGAAGLGKLTVLSALGQPLRAEVDISASRDELPTLAARLAPAEAFKQQGVEYVSALSSIRMAVEKRPSGQPYVRISTERALHEPFLGLLVELSWGSGRLVREYTFLLDPPAEVTQKAVVTPVTPPVTPPEAKVEPKVEPKVEAKVEAKPFATEAAKPAETAEAKPAAAPEAKPEAKVEAKVEAKESKPAAAEGGREVRRGETLGKIAAELKPEGVNLDQMLVALFRGNKDVFDGQNMNRLRAGRILKAPERDEILTVDAGEARKLVVAQSADFNAYRKKLAAAVEAVPAKEEAPAQAAAGKIAPKVEDKTPAAPAGTDKLEVSRTEVTKGAKDGKLQGRISALEEDLVARDRALKEANSRVAELEKNLKDLQKLAELKSQSGAQLQAQAGKPEAKKPEPAAPAAAPAPVPAKPVEAAKPAEPAKPAEAAKPEPAPPAKPAEPVKAEEPKPADGAAKPAEAPKPPPAKKKAAPPPPPPPEPTFLEAYGELLAMAGAAVVSLLLGLVGFMAIRKKRQAKAVAAESALTGDDLSANSVFGTTGGQSVDTGEALHTDFGQAAFGHDEGVDPVAEADVYMAYGRDAQAEEILIEALKQEPTRQAIHVKLLEIYSARKATRQFETLAMDLKGQTGGSGPDWDKVVAMGRSIDPGNPLYGAEAPAAEAPVPMMPASMPTPAAPAAPAMPMSNLAATVILTSDAPERMQATVTMPGQLAQMAAVAEAQPAADTGSLDFDLDLGGPAPTAPAAAAEPAKAETSSLDFDLDLGAAPAVEAAPAAAPSAPSLDIDLGFGGATAPAPAADFGIDFSLDAGPGTPAPAAAPAPAPAAAPSTEGGLDFEFDLGTPAAAPAAPAVDLSSISLDLGEPAPAPAAAADIPDKPEVATKLDLAQAYEEMGDKDGARELLQEVLGEGSPGQQETARTRLARIG